MPAWFCACGVPKGEEAAIFRAQGLVPMGASVKYRALVQLAGLKPYFGHDDKGEGWMWVHSALRRIIPSELSIAERQRICTAIGALAPAARDATLMELDAAIRLGGVPTGVAVEIGPDNTARLREAKKSTNIRKAVLAERALRESREP